MSPKPGAHGVQQTTRNPDKGHGEDLGKSSEGADGRIQPAYPEIAATPCRAQGRMEANDIVSYGSPRWSTQSNLVSCFN